MYLKAFRSVVLKSHVLLAIAWHSVVGFVVGKRKGQEPLLAYLRDVYTPHIVRILEWHGIPITITGNTSQLTGPALVIAPHESMIDTILGHLAVLGGRPAYVAKERLFHIPFFGACMRMAGMISVGEGDLRSMLKGMKEQLSQGRVVIVFPEATRLPRPHDLAEYMPRIKLFIRVAEKNNVPVVYMDFGPWYEVWGQPRTLFTACPKPVTIQINKPGSLISDLV